MLAASGVLAAGVWPPAYGAFWTPPPAAPADFVESGSLYDQLLLGVVRVEASATRPAPDRPHEFQPADFRPPDIGSAGRGSGFFFDRQGHIVTNHHVVAGATSIQITLSDGTWYPAAVVGQDVYSDLAVLRIPDLDRDIAPLPLDRDSVPGLGSRVYAFGFPSSLQGTLTQGIVSSIRSGMGTAHAGRYLVPRLVQSDALLLPGHSGGPLLNTRGEVVGVMMGIAYTGWGLRGLSRSIPLPLLRKVVPALIAEHQYTYPFLGVAGHDLTVQDALTRDLGSVRMGAYIADVQPGSAAAQGGIQPGDVLQAINGVPVPTFAELSARLVLQHEPGDTVEFSLLRDATEIQRQVILEERGSQQLAPVGVHL